MYSFHQLLLDRKSGDGIHRRSGDGRSRDRLKCVLCGNPVCQGLSFPNLLDAVQTDADTLLAVARIREEADVDITPHTRVHLRGVDDMLDIRIHHKGLDFTGRGKHPVAFALRAVRHTVRGSGTVAIVNADCHNRRALSVPLLVGADLRRLLDGGASMLLLGTSTVVLYLGSCPGLLSGWNSLQ